MNRFDNAVNALVDAYLNDTLYRGACTSCAVGNIVNAAHGIETPPCEIRRIELTDGTHEYFIGSENRNAGWSSMVITLMDSMVITLVDSDENKAHNKRAFHKTGYSFEEMQEIELVFMNNTTNSGLSSKEEIDQMHFEGLMAVVDLLISWENAEIDRSEIEAKFLAKV